MNWEKIGTAAITIFFITMVLVALISKLEKRQQTLIPHNGKIEYLEK